MAPMATCFVLFLVQVRAAEVSCGSGGVCEDSSMLQIESSPVRPRAVGGQKDEHGCLSAAGYSWDPEYGECIQPWNKPKKLEIKPLPLAPLPELAPVAPQVVGGQRDKHGCLIAAGYRWDPEYGECIQPWNKPQRLEIKPLPLAPVPELPIAPTINTPFCKNSRQQLCRMLCPPMQCPPNSCIMRQGSCCKMKCRKVRNHRDRKRLRK